MKKIILIALLSIGILLPSRAVRADVSPPPAPQLGSLEPFEYQETNVQMLYERVEMELESFLRPEEPSRPENRVHVTAYFTMRNQGDVPESMQVIFPLESFSNCRMGFGGGNSYTQYFIDEDSFRVAVNGANVPVEKVVTEHPDKNVLGLGDYCSEMSWAGFDVHFPVKEDVVIRVEYLMESMGVDSMQNIEYILETGAGWAGPIQRGYVIVKFPYTATAENVLAESTPGYQFLYNEAYWSFENLEPASENNIQLSIVSPDTWQKILVLRQDLKENPRLPDKWLELAQIYEDIAQWHGDILRSSEYFHKGFTAYEQGIAANPNHAELYAKYADYQLMSLSPRLIRQITEEEASRILYQLNKALALEPDNETARITLSNLLSVAPSVTFTPPPTLAPTATPLHTSTPSITPSATLTPDYFADMPVVITVVHTKIVKELTATSTRTPRATRTAQAETRIVESALSSDVENETSDRSPLSIAIIGMVATFIAGVVVATVWLKRTK